MQTEKLHSLVILSKSERVSCRKAANLVPFTFQTDNTVKMWILLFIVLVLPFNSSAVDWKETISKYRAIRESLANGHKPSSVKKVVTWHTIQFPSNTSPKVRVQDEPDEGDTEEDENEIPRLICGADCQGYVYQNATKSQVQSSFAYKVFSDEGENKVVDVDLDDAFIHYLYRWQHGERRLKRREEEAKANSRSRRGIVIGDDTRFEISDREWLNQNPFSTNVKISTGCSGVLISNLHVLTAASCVHNGRKMLEKMRDFHVGIRQKRQLTPEEEMGKNWKEAFRWVPVKKIYVPNEWSSKPPKGQKGKVALPIDKNYALIILKRELDRDFMNVSVGSVANVGEGKRVHFSSFDDIARPTLSYRFCTVEEETMEVLYQECDGTPQSVGAGVYVRRWNREKRVWDRSVVAIFTGHQTFYLEDGTVRDRNIAVKITPLKFAQICYWMTGDYGQCRG